MAPSPRSGLALRYLGWTLGLALVIALLRPGAQGPAPLLTMAAPALAVAVVAGRAGRGREVWRSMGWRRSGLRYWPLALAGPAVVAGTGYAVATVLGLARFPLPSLSPATVAPAGLHLVVGLVIGVGLALGEEVGWRGFLQPELERTLVPDGSNRRWGLGLVWLAVGLGHGLFHLPLLLLTGAYDPDGSRWVVAPAVVVTLTLAGSFYGWLRYRTASIWPVALAHAAVNVCFATAQRSLRTSSPDTLAYVAGEAGVVTIVVLGLVALTVSRQPGPRPPTRSRLGGAVGGPSLPSTEAVAR